MTNDFKIDKREPIDVRELSQEELELVSGGFGFGDLLSIAAGPIATAVFGKGGPAEKIASLAV
jgi:hypothetical protein